MTVMVLSIIGITLVATTNMVGAAVSVRSGIQPKIATIKATSKFTSRNPSIKIFTWPEQAGKIIELDTAATHLQITPMVQKGFRQGTHWAFRYVWSDSAPDVANIFSDAKNIAQKHFTTKSFVTSAISPQITLNQPQNADKFLTIYAFATNKDNTTGAPNFPHLIDYTAAVTFHVSKEIPQPTTEVETQKEVGSKPAPENDDWSQMETTVPGYKQ